MPAYLPVIKVILPYLAPLITSAVPIFTKSYSGSNSEQPSTTKLIDELQGAVKNNAESLKVIAKQLQTSIEEFDERELFDQKKLSEIHALIEKNSLEVASVKSAVDAVVKDVKITKMIPLFAMGLALVAVILIYVK